MKDLVVAVVAVTIGADMTLILTALAWDLMMMTAMVQTETHLPTITTSILTSSRR